MSPELALQAALPTTGTLDERLATALANSFRVALPTTSQTRSSTETIADGLVDRSEEAVRTEKSGDASSMTAPKAPPTAATALTGLTPGTTLGQDPMLRYLAAAAIYQEVNLLNRYITDAVRFRDAQAFLVRLQLSVLPARRALPYDVTTDITIHANDMQADAYLGRRTFDPDTADQAAWDHFKEERTGLQREAETLATTRAAQKLRIEDFNRARASSTESTGIDLQSDSSTKSKLKEQELDLMRLPSGGLRRCLSKSDAVTVVPLVVTDNLEGLAAARSTNITQQLALALLATAGNVGLGGEFARTREELRRQEGRDTNSLFTVARLTDDTIRVRLGAAQSPRYGNAMLSRTHNISLLVIFKPCRPDMILPTGEERSLSVITRAAFTDSETGETLRYRSGASRLLGLTRELNRKYNNSLSYFDYAALFKMVLQQDKAGFSRFFERRLDRYKAYDCNGLTPGTVLSGLLGRRGLSSRLGPDELAELKSSLDTSYASLPAECMSERLAFQVASVALWTDLQSIRPIAEYSYGSIPLVLRSIEPTPPPTGQLVQVASREAGLEATLFGGRDLSGAKDIRARLVLTDSSGNEHSHLSRSASVSPDGMTVSLTFSPLESLQSGKADNLSLSSIHVDFGVLPDGKRLGPPVGTRDDSASDWVGFDFTYNSVRLATPKAQPKLTYGIIASANAIVVGTGNQGKLSIIVRQEEGAESAANPILTVEGPRVVEVSKGGSQQAQKGSGWALSGPGEYILTLDSLVPGQVVQVGISDLSEAGSESPISPKLQKPVLQGSATAPK